MFFFFKAMQRSEILSLTFDSASVQIVCFSPFSDTMFSTLYLCGEELRIVLVLGSLRTQCFSLPADVSLFVLPSSAVMQAGYAERKWLPRLLFALVLEGYV